MKDADRDPHLVWAGIAHLDHAHLLQKVQAVAELIQFRQAGKLRDHHWFQHLLARDMIENERSTSINPGEAVEEKVSLSDRFGLWLGFHRCSQDEYLDMVSGYARHFGMAFDAETLRAQALEWATTRGSRSGRVAWQFIQDFAGRAHIKLKM